MQRFFRERECKRLTMKGQGDFMMVMVKCLG